MSDSEPGADMVTCRTAHLRAYSLAQSQPPKAPEPALVPPWVFASPTPL